MRISHNNLTCLIENSVPNPFVAGNFIRVNSGSGSFANKVGCVVKVRADSQWWNCHVLMDTTDVASIPDGNHILCFHSAELHYCDVLEYMNEFAPLLMSDAAEKG